MIDYPPPHAMGLLAALATGDVVYPDDTGELRHTAVNGTAPVDRLGFDDLESRDRLEMLGFQGIIDVRRASKWCGEPGAPTPGPPDQSAPPE